MTHEEEIQQIDDEMKAEFIEMLNDDRRFERKESGWAKYGTRGKVGGISQYMTPVMSDEDWAIYVERLNTRGNN